MIIARRRWGASQRKLRVKTVRIAGTPLEPGCHNVGRNAERDGLKSFGIGQSAGKTSYDMLHGTRSSYKGGCRCEECRRANADYEKLRSQRHGRRLTSKCGSKPKHGGDPSHPLFPHGYTGYILGCRCVDCTKRNAEKRAAYVAKHNHPGSDFAIKQAAMKAAWAKTPEGQLSHKTSHASHKAKLKAWMRRTRDRDEIALIGRIHAACPKAYHVDHIIPLSRDGWHTADNLQYLPAAINMNKKTKLDYDAGHHAIRWQDVLGSPFNDYPREGSSSKRSEAHGVRSSRADHDIVSSVPKGAAAAMSGGVRLANWHEDQAIHGLIGAPL